ncbi:MAG: hypothetical protein K6G50_02560 [bacterium]|nr:hypothetical protein [bacterium]
MAKKNNVNYPFLITIAALTAIIAGLELFAQFAAPPKTDTPLPYRKELGYVANQQYLHDDILGLLRISEWMCFTPPGGNTPKRILVTGGCSISNPVATTFQSMPGRLQKKLYANGYNAEVINGGLNGGDTASELAFLKDTLKQIKPDIVIVYTGANEDERLRLFKYNHPDWSPKKEKLRGILEYSSLYRLITFKMREQLRNSGQKAVDLSDIDNIVTTDDTPIIEKVYRKNLERICSLCKSANTKLILYPYVYNRRAIKLLEAPETNLNMIAEEVAEKAGVNYIELQPKMEKRSGYDLSFNFFTDVDHFNPIGSEAFADVVFEDLTSLGYLGKATTETYSEPEDPKDLQSFLTVRGGGMTLCGGPIRYNLKELAFQRGQDSTAFEIENYNDYLSSLSGKEPIIVMTGRGHAAFLMREFETAADFYRKAIEIEPKNAVLWRNLGHAQNMDAETAKALESYRKYLELGGKDPYIARLISWVDANK